MTVPSGPWLDVYGLTARRDATTISHFLDQYIDRAASEPSEGAEIDLVPRVPTQQRFYLDDMVANPEAWLASREWLPVSRLGEVVQLGLEDTCRAFS
jgi:hypothetical protein